MKFEKFFKATGTHGVIVEKSEVDRWLLCEGVGMKIPNGVTNLGVKGEATDIFNAIVRSDSDNDVLTLREAILRDPEGKANDIIRVFETDFGDRVGIYNGNYGLIERKDILTYLEIEDENETDPDGVTTRKFIVVRNHKLEPIGFIAGSVHI